MLRRTGKRDKGAKIAKRVTAKKGRNSGKFAPKEFVAGPAAKIGKRPRCDNSRLPLLILSESIMQNPYLKYERSAHQGKPLVSKETIERKENQQPKNTKAHYGLCAHMIVCAPTEGDGAIAAKLRRRERREKTTRARSQNPKA